MTREINYTDAEKSLIDYLKKKRGKPVSTLDIIEYHYPNQKERPFHARNSVVTTLSTIIKKVKAKQEDFKICKSERRGPHPSEYWIEK